MKVKYYFLKAIFWLLSKIPFWFYHGLSTLIGFLFIKTKIYRYKVVMDNLRKSFPEKSEKEIQKIANKFYYHFSDLLIESIKAFGFSQSTIKKRYKINPNPAVQKLLDEKQNITMILPHFANWEWAAQGFNFMVERNQPLVLIMYKPLKDKVMDKLMKDNRTRFPGNYLFPKNNATREVLAHQDEHYLLGFAADQSPANVYNSYWMNFLGRETGVFFGVEKFSKKFDLAPVYAHVKKMGRSRFEIDLEVITDSPKETPYGYITEKHMRLLEADIYKSPHLWLWTHKRWKRGKPADYEQKRPQQQ
ncbi:acetyltransferase [Marivirga tractuosa]|uniref:Lipid A biosynthesis acyltransferase n=1 Tax=Marivirga tractuosa (strain ATCC 23168 / DSM 4126 / NBRC 15989 / NCIMB 1408 / VKM B-1430 / H-43) TaxID=643867 RepID=E4TN64_MARTH|nr:lipid A biosynthesis acyltransferase [Marivirga tractuosa]ADR22478.1 lipid A biosynthesis acyltransferase [Marivirga tractuosa DSM 4126]BDD16851.1 acetyltransferase [Marivirga tractuosa]